MMGSFVTRALVLVILTWISFFGFLAASLHSSRSSFHVSCLQKSFFKKVNLDENSSVSVCRLVLGYAYPAYECFKAVELNKPEVEQLIFWCQYWILVAALTVFERVGESFISWVPMYNEAKLASFVYLWYPKTKGTTYVYETFFRPYVAKHENEIDRNLLELRTRAGDIVALYWQKTASYGQTRLFEVLQYIASQSPSQSSRSHPVQGLGRGMDLVFLDDIINCLVEVRSARPGQQVQLPKAEIQQLCVVSWDIFLSQPNLPGLESPIKIFDPPNGIYDGCSPTNSLTRASTANMCTIQPR
ncbi:uncharacterized protein LOC120103851 isoform X5 [Phoenix dactylifera]|uniref:HVA22-like protein n=1 Tax=Phoenix dactylifera TaxID=42345 RepID=A0A8B9A293_PHODC|nr:uncharacterized protein LOC120103851 isoform X5 [Phoenix dactylifera]